MNLKNIENAMQLKPDFGALLLFVFGTGGSRRGSNGPTRTT